jgi:IgGFc binding protein/CHU_C Type IX secretion signal domain/SprB repeat
MAQLDSIHWMPPMHARVDWGSQYLFLSTPERTPFEVTIQDGSGNVINTVSISNTSPHTYNVGSTNDTYTLVPESSLHKPLKNKGLVLTGTKKFYAYFRSHSSNQNQAADLTCKGRASLGKTFRIGHLLQEIGTQKANFVGVIATEDSTQLILSGFNRSVSFRKNGADVTTNGADTMWIQKGECLVYSQYLTNNAAAQPPNGLMGALLTSSKPIAVNVGSWCGAPVTASDKDVGIDQIVPFENVGKEYILSRGNGSPTLERPIVVAHRNNTQVKINGNPGVTLNAGEFYAVPTSSFTTNNNLHIKSTQPIYVYQNVGGAPAGTSNEFRTAGLIFVPPISCAISNGIDNIVNPNSVGTMLFNGGVMITAMKDSIVEVLIDGVAANIGAPQPVQGNPDFVTYRQLTLFSLTRRVNTISVKAAGAVQVAMYGQNNAASFAAFYSGFSKTIEPSVDLVNIGDGVCPDTLIARGRFDGVQWMYEDSILKFGKDTVLIISAPGRYVASGYLGVCRQDETATDTLDIEFQSPVFPYFTRQPACFGDANGQIQFGKPAGGFPPYQYSVDNGRVFSQNALYNQLKAGIYKLVVRDSIGCYNRPWTITVGQPAELKVEIRPYSSYPGVLKVGQFLQMQGMPNRKVVKTVWIPRDTATCTNCLFHTIHPIQTTFVQLTVTDSAGCIALDTFTVYVEPNVYAPNVLYPESQNVENKSFTLFSRDNLPIPHLAIYDRWGEHIFDATNITTNQLAQGWDGTFRGKKVDVGVYVFFAEVEVLPGRIELIKGDITVLY